MPVNTSVLLTIVVYFSILLLTGFIFKRFVTDGSDYFKSGSRATWWMAGTSIFMAGFSAWTFTGAAGMAFSHGWSVLLIYIMTPLALLIQALFFAKRFRQLRATTVPELIRARYNPLTQQVYACLTTVLYILLGAIQLYALAIFVGAFFGFPVIQTIVVLGSVIGIYIILGGSWAAMGADNIQAVFIFGIVVVVAILSLDEIGGFSGLLAEIKSQGLVHDFRILKDAGEVPLGNFSMVWLLAMTTLYLFEGASFAHAVKYFSVKDGKTASKAAFFALVLALVGMFIWFIPPIVARLLYADEVLATSLTRPEEGAFAVIALQLLPSHLGGLLAVAIMGATVSSMDTTINRNSAILVRDIAPAIGRKIPFVLYGSELLRGRIASVFLCLAVIGLAISYELQQQMGVFDLLQRILAMLALPMTIPLALGILIMRTPPWSALATCGAGLVVTVVALVSEEITGESWTFAHSIFLTCAACLPVFLASMLFANDKDETYREHVRKFFELMRCPVDFAREVGHENDHLQLRAMSTLFLIAGTVLGILVFATPSESVQKPFGILVSVFFGLGVLMLASSFLREKKIAKQEEKLED